MLRVGMVVRDQRRRVIRLMGRNACDHRYWWGHRLKPDGQPNPDTMPVVAERDVVAVRTKTGVFQMIIPGIFG